MGYVDAFYLGGALHVTHLALYMYSVGGGNLQCVTVALIKYVGI
jgi:hypothetical protein